MAIVLLRLRELLDRSRCLLRRPTNRKLDESIKTRDLWKTYGEGSAAHPAVRGLNLSVAPHSVYAFLGPNGAGKSTTIRMILGLQRPDRGSIEIFGRPLERERLPLLRRIGSLVEAPSLYLHLTGRENLEVHRRLLGVPRRVIDETLDAVDLLPFGDRLVRKYSSGMKQRLGLAVALLGKPELLVLDEPTNGLDPAGIHEVRELIRDLPNRSGATVFLSSHLLAEVEQVATHLAIISQGSLKFEGTPLELQQRSTPRISVRVNQPEQASAVLTRAGYSMEAYDDRLLIAADGDAAAAAINAILVQAGIAVYHLAARNLTLEEFFLQLTTPLVSEQEFVNR